MRQAVLACLIVFVLAACSHPKPPAGRWEGTYETQDTMIVARLEIGSDGQVRVSAPDLLDIGAVADEDRTGMRQKLASDLAAGWDNVDPRPMDFDGKTFRKPGGYAPQMVWDKATNQITLELYIGAKPALPVTLRPVAMFHDNPWPSG